MGGWRRINCLSLVFLCFVVAAVIINLITYMKKLLDSDWLRAVQLNSNTSAKSVIPVQITNQNS